MSDTPKEGAYDEQIAPLMAEIIEVCKENDIGLVAQFELDNRGTNEEPDWLACTTVIPGESERHKKLAHIAKPQTVNMMRTTVRREGEPDEVTLSAFVDGGEE